MGKSKYYINALSFLTLVLWYISTSFFKVDFGNLYYVFFAVVFILLLPAKKITLNLRIAVLIAICGLSLIFNDIPSFFKADQRFYIFILLMMVVGPLINNDHTVIYKNRLFKILNIWIIISVMLSFIILVFNIPLGFGYSGYFGIYNHSMFLGPMAGIAAITSLHKFYNAERRNFKIMFLLIAGASLITCIGAGSRSALLAAIGGMLFFLYKVSHGRILKTLRILVIIFLIGAATYPIWEEYTSHIVQKMESSESRGSLTSSRDILWEARLIEFESSPIYGIGFATADPNLDSKMNLESGGIEPGSSWLAILAMTGVLGFVSVIYIIGSNFMYCYRNKSYPKESAFLLGLMTFFILHFFAEGYIFAAGSGLFFYFWLLIANAEIFRKSN